MVKCAECGFLTVRKLTDGSLIEVDGGFRKYGKATMDKSERQFLQESFICFARAFDLIEEGEDTERQQALLAEQDEPMSDWVGYLREIITRDRECAEYTEWQQGFTPKEHREMLDRQELRDYQYRQRKEDKRWRIIELVVIGFIAVLVAGGFTILGAFIERGS